MHLVRTLSIAAMTAAISLSAAPALAVPAGPPAGVTVDFTNVTGTWFNVVGAGPNSDVGFTGNGTANTQVRWGQGANRSGYDFNVTGIPQLTVAPGGSSAVTPIASFTHVNQPITAGTSITKAVLRFTADVSINGSFLNTVSFVYNFRHDETPNGAHPCAYGGANDIGVNINGCADRVTTNFNSKSQSFDIGGTAYTLDVVGFLAGTPPVETTSFLTTEQVSNSAFIMGKITPFTAAVPESSTWAMLIAGFGLIGAAQRRQRRAVAA